MPRSTFPEIPTERKQRGPRTEKGSGDQEGSTSRIMGSKSCASDASKDSYERARGRLQT